MATQVTFLTVRAKSTSIILDVNRNKSGEYHNDENLIKS